MEKDNNTNQPDNNDNNTDNLRATKIVTATAAVLLVFTVGYFVGATVEGVDDDGEGQKMSMEESHSHDGEPVAAHGDHMHEQYEVADGEVVPEITNLTVEKDSKSGWNVSFETANFTFTPENVNSDHVPGEGHAHIYVDGEKVNRLYSADYHLGELSEGEHDISVVLNTNDHSEYAVDDETVEATTTVVETNHAD